MKTIIIYASHHGSVKKCAEILSGKLTGEVILHNLKEGNVSDLSQYDRIIIGGSIHAGSIQKEVSEFCVRNLTELKKKNVGLYICCMNMKEAEKQLNTVFPQELINCAAAKESFGGEFKFKEMNFAEKLITKMVCKMLAKDDPSLIIDTKKELSMLSEENIDKFAKLIS